MNDSQQRGRSRLRGLLRETQAAAEEMDRERTRFAGLADGQAAPRAVASFNLFQTPEKLAARLVELAELPQSGRVLEPSAGLGRIFRAIRAKSDCHVTLVEISAECCRELHCEATRLGGAEVHQADFLACTPGDLGRFDAIVMNPPFHRGQDIQHIEHAQAFLQPGGRLVALCSAGPRQQAALRPHAKLWIDLPADAFASEGTKVRAALLVC